MKRVGRKLVSHVPVELDSIQRSFELARITIMRRRHIVDRYVTVPVCHQCNRLQFELRIELKDAKIDHNSYLKPHKQIGGNCKILTTSVYFPLPSWAEAFLALDRIIQHAAVPGITNTGRSGVDLGGLGSNNYKMQIADGTPEMHLKMLIYRCFL